jgi:hypothetical protein
MKEVHSEIQINATPEQVWEVLTNFERYPEWNPYMVKASGTLVAGQDVRMTLRPPGKDQKSSKSMLTIVKPNQELRWQGFTVFGGLIDHEHIFTIEELEPNRVRFVQSERFQGLLVPFTWKSRSASIKAGFEAMNDALKKRVEGNTVG